MIRIRNQRHRLGQNGFTILELMIATAVLSTMLLLLTIIMISIGNLYYKGINQARVQDDVHGIADDVAQHLQLGGSAAPIYMTSPGNKIAAYCIGDTRYVFVLGKRIGSGFDTDSPPTPLSPHVLWRDHPTGCPSLSDTFLNSPTTTGDELITPNSRLINFQIIGAGASLGTPTPSPYTVSIGVAYGAADLLNNLGPSATCLGSTGDQFCATANLTTTVAKRL